MKKIFIDCLSGHLRAALVEDGTLTELIYQDNDDSPSVGDIYIGRIDKILPRGISFINIGRDKPVFIQRDDLKCGSEILVQISKEELNEKCAVATDRVGINGKYTVVNYRDSGIGVSKKITDYDKREALKSLGEKYVSDNYAIVFRTNSGEAPISEVEAELSSNIEELKSLVEKSKYIKAPALVKREADIITKTIRDLITEDCDDVVINAPCSINYNATLYEGSVPMFNYYGIESQIEKLFNRKIWLKSGGYIVIDETEAMTVIDVNSGKATDKLGFSKVNKEAAAEAARQIRLRNLSGMIIIDFINKGNNRLIYKELQRHIALDRVKTHIVGMTELGLMQLTRQKIRKPLKSYITHSCPVCQGTGYVKSSQYISEKILNQIADIFASTIYNKVDVNTSKHIINALKDSVKNIEEKFNSKIVLNEITTTRFDYYELHKSRI